MHFLRSIFKEEKDILFKDVNDIESDRFPVEVLKFGINRMLDLLINLIFKYII